MNQTTLGCGVRTGTLNADAKTMQQRKMTHERICGAIKMSTSQFFDGDVATATMNMPLETGEHFGGPITIGYYKGDNSEIWVEFEGMRLNIQRSCLKDFIKQLKRADSIAAEQ